MSVLLGRTGLGGLIVVIIAVWAGAAVFMLAGTLRAAERIDNRVGAITPDVSDANQNLDNVKLAARTGRIAARIDSSAKPLSGQFAQIVGTARSIDRSAGSILATAGSINRTAGSINSNARSINTRVVSIEGGARSIDTSVGSIGAGADSINRRVRGIESSASSIDRRVGLINRNARSINGRVGSILRTAGLISSGVVVINNTAAPILPTVVSIDAGAEGINIRARRVTEIAEDRLKSDTEEIFDESDEIHEHTNSIDCSAALQTLRVLSGRDDQQGECGEHQGDSGRQTSPP